MKWPSKNLLAVCDTVDITPVAYINVYEEGDIWIKVKGCEGCDEESRQRCCGRCAFKMERGCAWHFEKGGQDTAKPFICVVRPYPHEGKYHCQQEWLCVVGKWKGRKVFMGMREDHLRGDTEWVEKGKWVNRIMTK